MQLGFVSDDLVNEHIGKITAALPYLMQTVAQMAHHPGAERGLMILDMQASAEVLMSVNWVNAKDIPQSEAPVPQMAMECRPGCPTKMTVVIAHDDGGRSAYLISPMVNWREFQYGYCILSEAHFPPPPRAPSRPQFRKPAKLRITGAGPGNAGPFDGL